MLNLIETIVGIISTVVVTAIVVFKHKDRDKK